MYTAVTGPGFTAPLTEQSPYRGAVTDPVSRLVDAMGDLVSADRLGDAVHPPMALLFIFLAVVVVRRWPVRYALYTVPVLVLALSAESFNSLERYGLNAFPLVLALATVTKRPDSNGPPYALGAAGVVALTSLSWVGNADAAQKLGLQTQILDVSKRDDVDRVFAAQANSRPAALIVLPGPMIFALGSDLVNRAESLAIPVIYPFEEMTEAGGLMSYAPDLLDSYRRAARYVDRILKGAKAGDMAIEQPTRLLLAINMRAAKAQGIRIPQSILQRADRIIE